MIIGQGQQRNNLMEFMVNGLTGPRVEAGEYLFDAPTLSAIGALTDTEVAAFDID
ncbi:MAG: hypothetical protein ABF318_17290 [Ketobacter sp.]